MMITFGRPLINDKEASEISNVLDSGIFVHGSKTADFENDFAQRFNYKYAVSVANCTAGLHLAHFSLTKNIDISTRSKLEVICPAMSHVATAHAINLAGMKPVFVDCNPEDGNIDVDQIEKNINQNTIGIAAMHFNGVPCKIETILSIANTYNLYVIEDCAIALGAEVNGKPVGTFGNAGAFSFHPVKQLTTGEGGMVVTNDKILRDELVLERAFGVTRAFNERKIPGQYDVKHLGFNYRMAEIPAAIGLAQLEKFSYFTEKRKKNFNVLRDFMSEIQGVRVIAGEDLKGRSYYCLIAQIEGANVDSRNAILLALKNAGVQTSVYYPHPIPRLQYYRTTHDYKSADFRNSEMIADQCIAFPIGPHLDENDMRTIAKELKRSL